MDASDISKTILECPIAIQWIISESRIRSTKPSPFQFLKSDDFSVFDKTSEFRYCLYFHPWIKTPNNPSESWISLNVNLGNEKSIEAEYKVFVESANFFQIFKKSYGKNLGFGCCCCLSEELFDPEKKFIVDGKMVINVQGVFKIERSKSEKVLEIGSSTSLGDGLWERNDKDFTILVEGKEIQIHKLILASRSPVFETMFETPMIESSENYVKIIDFSFKTVEAAISMCYQKSFNPASLTIDDYMLLLQFFDKYNIDALKEDIENYLMKEIHESTVCRLVNCSVLSNAPKLYHECGNFLKNALDNKIPVSDLDMLDKDLAITLLKNVFCYVSKTL